MSIERSHCPPAPHPVDLKCSQRATEVRSQSETGRRRTSDGRADTEIVASPAMDFILAVARYQYVEARERYPARQKGHLV